MTGSWAPAHHRERPDRPGTPVGDLRGSDWFWWFGDHNPADSVSDFDRLYRQQLTNLYQMLGEEAADAGPAHPIGVETRRTAERCDAVMDEEADARRAASCYTSLRCHRDD